MKLANNHEIICNLESFKDCQNFIYLIFKIEKEVKIQKNSIPLDLLQKFVNRRIGIINIDGQFSIRILGDILKDQISSELEHDKTIVKLEEIFKRRDKETTKKEK